MAKTAAVFLGILALVHGIAGGDPIVSTKYGSVRGEYSNWPDVQVTYFRGIRYAAAPVGDLRFRQPVEPASWAPDIYDATTFGPSCPQNLTGYPDWMATALPNEDIDEDCLMLNVYVPGHTIPPTQSYPVMVWIHGGSFLIGQGMLYESTVLAGFYDVIVVTINYRLGTLGFLSTGDEHAPGNFGLHDQILALQWVQENIGGFGGDKNMVTIFGESAGGISTGILAHSPRATGFNRVVSQSGVLSPGFIVPIEQATSFAYDVGYAAGCNTTTNPDLTDHAELLDCLRTLPWEDILDAQSGTVPFPVEDGDIIPSLEEVAASGKFQDYDYMAGTLDWEAALITTALPPLDNGQMSQPMFNLLVTAEVQLFYDQNHDHIIDASLYQYTDWYNEDDGAVRLDQYRHFMNDLTFLAPCVLTVRQHSARGIFPPQPTTNTYHYYFHHRPSFYTGPDYVDGAEHAVEILFVFGHVLAAGYGPVANISIPDYEKELGHTMATYWTNFAKTGDPNKPNAVPHDWPAFENDQQKYVDFTVNMTAPDYDKENIRANDVAFWIEYVSGLHDQEPCPAASEADDDKPVMTLLELEADEAEAALYGLFIACVCLLVAVIGLIAGMAVIIRKNRRSNDDEVPLHSY
ncbi:carboxylesterase 5A-like [Ptychodera flava]|uniref:carboxylesterase 5A-like n=1 Tax=Ptychodera flava TaxID=63121 RepID=UPI003969EE23